MTFAQELRHAVSVEPILDSTPPPAQPFGGSDEDWIAYDITYKAWKESRIPKKKDPGPIRVLEVWEGFDEFLVICEQKGIFDMQMWTEMSLTGDTPAAQLSSFIKRKVPLPTWACLWTQGTYFRLLVRVSSTIVHSALSVGVNLQPLDQRLPMYRGLWDCGIKTIEHQLLPDNPYTRVLMARGEYTYEMVGKYWRGHLTFTERP